MDSPLGEDVEELISFTHSAFWWEDWGMGADPKPPNPWRAHLLSGGLLVLSLASQLSQAKGWADFIPDKVVFALWFVPIVPLGWWLLSNERLKGARGKFASSFHAKPRTTLALTASATGTICICLFFIGTRASRIIGARDTLHYFSSAVKTQHFPGSTFGGIVWPERENTDLRVTISNDTDNIYEDVDLTVDPNAWIVGMGQLQQFPKCSIGPRTEVQASMDLTPDGSSKSYSVNPPILASLGDGVRVVCDKFSPHSGIALILATMKSPDLPGVYVVKEQKPNRGAMNPPSDVLVSGSYKSGSKIVKVEQKLWVQSLPSKQP